MRSLSKRKRNTSAFKARNQVKTGLMMTAMLDILMAVLFFLLKNYSTMVTDFNVSRDITLPQSTAMVPPTSALQLVVTQKAIVLDDKEICTVVNGKIPSSFLFKDGITIIPLAHALDAQKQKSLYIQKQSDKSSFTGTIVLQADKDLKFDVLKRVIYTAGIRDFVMLKLAVVKKDAV